MLRSATAKRSVDIALVVFEICALNLLGNGITPNFQKCFNYTYLLSASVSSARFVARAVTSLYKFIYFGLLDEQIIIKLCSISLGRYLEFLNANSALKIFLLISAALRSRLKIFELLYLPQLRINYDPH